MGGTTGDTPAGRDTSEVSPTEPGGVTGNTSEVPPTESDYEQDHEQDHDRDHVPVAAPPRRRIEEIDNTVVTLLEEARELVGGDGDFVAKCLSLYRAYPALGVEHAELILAQFDAINERSAGDKRGTFADYRNLPGAFYKRLEVLAWGLAA